LPRPPRGRPWRRCIDTALASPDDVRRGEDAPTVASAVYVVQPRSVVLLVRAV
jgi:isoamylase